MYWVLWTTDVFSVRRTTPIFIYWGNDKPEMFQPLRPERFVIYVAM